MTTEQYSAAVDQIWQILAALPGPRDAVRVLCGAHVLLLKANETGADRAHAAAKEFSDAVTDVYLEELGIAPRQ